MNFFLALFAFIALLCTLGLNIYDTTSRANRQLINAVGEFSELSVSDIDDLDRICEDQAAADAIEEHAKQIKAECEELKR